ncbi:hypothetical protein K8Q93_03790 [Candidatus Parcubacteria bacterium]|nr:hypothetical protein [Candidatus Parcubacteria bacterium]
MLLVLFLGSIYYLYAQSQEPSVKPNTVTYVREQNADFKKGLAHMKAREFSKAIPFFQAALLDAQDLNQEGYIKYNVGYAQGLAKEYQSSIATLREVAANENYADIIRAWSIQLMGELYLANNKDPEYSKYVFDKTPYSAFNSNGNIEAAYTRLSEYASSFYPTAVSLFRISFDKSFPEILALSVRQARTSADEENLKSLWNQVHEAIRIGNDELIAARTLGFDNSVLSARITRQAILLGIATLTGEDHAAEAEALYKEAWNLTEGNRDQRIWTGYQYALYLSQQYGKSKAGEISVLLAPFSDPAYRNERFYKYLASKEALSDVQTRLNVERISLVDEEFAALMRSFGWKV